MRSSESGSRWIAHLIDAVDLLPYPLGFVYVTAWQSVPFSLALMRVSLVCGLAAIALLASCAQVTVVGAHRDDISRDDSAEIKRLVSHRRDLPFDVLTIQPARGDTAAVTSAMEFGGYQTFTVHKVRGEWKIDDATIQQHMILH